MKPHALLFGCGFLGKTVAIQARNLGFRITAVTRDPEKGARLRRAGMTAIVADWNERPSLQRLPEVDRVLIAVGYQRPSRRSIRDVYVQGLDNALAMIPGTPRIVYCSTTGVFHHADGRWVDETTPCHPRRESARAHLMAEELLARRRPHSHVILRLAGLYGPNRVPRAETIRAGETLPAIGNSYLNLIHRDDAAACVISAWNHPQPNRLYVVADRQPVRRETYYREIARLLRTPFPGFEPPSNGRPHPRRDSDKRVDARRMQNDLLPRLQYPTYREGLRAILNS